MRGTIGVFISMAGYTADAIAALFPDRSSLFTKWDGSVWVLLVLAVFAPRVGCAARYGHGDGCTAHPRYGSGPASR
jgi:hypothetical protein